MAKTYKEGIAQGRRQAQLEAFKACKICIRQDIIRERTLADVAKVIDDEYRIVKKGKADNAVLYVFVNQIKSRLAKLQEPRK
jgi:hypothetical protein